MGNTDLRLTESFQADRDPRERGSRPLSSKTLGWCNGTDVGSHTAKNGHSMIPRALLLLLSIMVFNTTNLDAAILTVGQNGTYPFLQDAIDTAIATGGGHNEIRVQSGTYQEALSIVAPKFEGTLLVLGGWNDNFSARSSDPHSTVVDGSQTVRPLTLEISSGEILIDSITFSNGRVEDAG